MGKEDIEAICIGIVGTHLHAVADIRLCRRSAYHNAVNINIFALKHGNAEALRTPAESFPHIPPVLMITRNVVAGIFFRNSFKQCVGIFIIRPVVENITCEHDNIRLSRIYCIDEIFHILAV